MTILVRSIVLVAAASLALACSSTGSGASAQPTPTASITAGASLAFTPTSISAATVHETCSWSQLGGPASDDAIVILLTDDPNVVSACRAFGPGPYGQSYLEEKAPYHYVVLQAMSSGGVGPGDYGMTAPTSPANPFGPSYSFIEVAYPPAAGEAPRTLDASWGMLSLESVGATVKGSFELRNAPVGAGPSVASGTFVAPICGAIASGCRSPCAAAPGLGQ